MPEALPLLPLVEVDLVVEEVAVEQADPAVRQLHLSISWPG